MANERQESVYVLHADAQQFIQQLGAAASAMEGLQRLVAQSPNANSNAAAAYDQHGRSLSTFTGHVNTANSTLARFATTAAGTVAGLAGFSILQGIGDGIRNFVGGMVDANAKTETWQVTMKSLLGAMGQTGDAQGRLAEATSAASEKYAAKWREAEEKRADAAEKYAERRGDLEERLTELDGRQVEKRRAAFERAEAEREHDHQRAVEGISRREEDANAKYERQVETRRTHWENVLTEQERKHGETMEDLRSQQAKADQDYDRSLSERGAKWERQLAGMETAHRRTVQSLEQDLRDLDRDTADRLADMQQDAADRRADLNARFQERGADLQRSARQARTPQERQRIQQQQRELQQQRAAEMARQEREQEQATTRYERDQAKRREALERRIAAENEKYEEQRRRVQEDSAREIATAERTHQEAAAKLTARITKAEEDYARQRNAAQGAMAAELQELDRAHDEVVNGLRSLMDAANAEWERGRANRISAHDAEIAEIAAGEERKRAALLQQLSRLDQDYLRSLRDLGQQEAEIATANAKDVEAAVKSVLNAPGRATTISLFDRLGLSDADMKAKLEALEKYLIGIGERTPIVLDKVFKMAQSLVTVGLDPTAIIQVVDRDGSLIEREFLDVTADWIAAMKTFGPGVQDVVENFFRYVQGGRFGEAMEQLRQLGLNPKDLEEFGIRFDKAGAIVEGQGKVISATMNIIQRNFGGVAAEQSKTFEGIISNLQDYSFKLFRFAGEPFFEQLRSKAEALYKALSNEDDPTFRDTISGMARLFGETLASAIDFLGSTVGQVLPILAGLKRSGDEDLSPLQRVLLPLVDAFRGLGKILSDNGPLIQQALGGLAIAAGALLGSAALGGLAAFLAATGPLAVALVGLGAIIAVLRQGWEENWGGIQEKFAAVAEWISTTGLTRFQEFTHWLQEVLLPAVERAAEWIGERLGVAFAAFGDWITNTGLPTLERLGLFLGERVLPEIQALAGWLNDHVMPAVGAFAGFLVETLIPALARLYAEGLGRTLEILGRYAEFVANNVITKTKSWGEALGELGEGIDRFVTWLGESDRASQTWVASVNRSWGEAVAGIGGAFDSLGTTVHNTFLGESGDGGLLGMLRGLPGQAGGLLLDTGAAMIQGLLQGITTTLGGAEGVQAWAGENILSPFMLGIRTVFGIESPSKVMIPIGAEIWGGAGVGILAEMRLWSETTLPAIAEEIQEGFREHVVPAVAGVGAEVGTALGGGISEALAEAMAAAQEALSGLATQQASGGGGAYIGGGLSWLGALFGGGEGGQGVPGGASRPTQRNLQGVNPYGGVTGNPSGGLMNLLGSLAGVGGTDWAQGRAGTPPNGIQAFWSAIAGQSPINNTLGGIAFSPGLINWNPTQYVGGQPLTPGAQSNPLLPYGMGGASSFGTGAVPQSLLDAYNGALRDYEAAQAAFLRGEISHEEMMLAGRRITSVSEEMMRASGGYVGRQPYGTQINPLGPSWSPARPALAEGGIITRETTVTAGEAGPEAILPLPASGAGVRILGIAEDVMMALHDRFGSMAVDLVAKITNALETVRFAVVEILTPLREVTWGQSEQRRISEGLRVDLQATPARIGEALLPLNEDLTEHLILIHQALAAGQAAAALQGEALLASLGTLPVALTTGKESLGERLAVGLTTESAKIVEAINALRLVTGSGPIRIPPPPPPRIPPPPPPPPPPPILPPHPILSPTHGPDPKAAVEWWAGAWQPALGHGRFLRTYGDLTAEDKALWRPNPLGPEWVDTPALPPSVRTGGIDPRYTPTGGIDPPVIPVVPGGRLGGGGGPIFMAEGGIVSQPTAAIIGEAGTEAVIPLPASGAPMTIAHFAETAMREWFERFIPAEMDLTRQITESIRTQRLDLIQAVNEGTRATRDLLPLVVPFTGASSALAALVPAAEATTAAVKTVEENTRPLSGALTSIFNALGILHTDNTARDPTLLTRLDSTVNWLLDIAGRITGLAVGIHTDDEITQDWLSSLHTDLVYMADLLHTDLVAVRDAVLGQTSGGGGGGGQMPTGLATHQDMLDLIARVAGSNTQDNLFAILVGVAGVVGAKGDATKTAIETLNTNTGTYMGTLTAAVNTVNTSVGTVNNNLVSSQTTVATRLQGILDNWTSYLSIFGPRGDADGRSAMRTLAAIRFATGGGAWPTGMAVGGLALGPTRALIGEAGPELVMPLGRGMQRAQEMGLLGRGGYSLEYHSHQVKELGEDDFEMVAYRLEATYGANH